MHAEIEEKKEKKQLYIAVTMSLSELLSKTAKRHVKSVGATQDTLGLLGGIKHRC